MSSSQVPEIPDNRAVAAEIGALRSRRRRPLTPSRVLRGSVPYLLILPVAVVIGAILGYPLYKLVTLSFQQYGLPELIQRKGTWVGFDNYASVLRDEIFWDTLVRTVVFTAANVGLTIVLGTLLALLLVRVSTWVRVLLTAGLVLAWAMPAVVAVQVFYWMTNFQNGVLNYVLTELHVGDYSQHDWYATTFSKLAMVTLLIVWGAIPFVTITVYAGLAQVPRELVEAAEIDGAGPLARLSRRHLSRPEADSPDPDEPLDHLGLRRLHPAVPADRRLSARPDELSDGRLRLHRGVPALRLRARGCDLAPDAADGRRAERRLRPPHGEDGGRSVSARPTPRAERRSFAGSGDAGFAASPGTSSGWPSSWSSSSRSSG